MGVSVSTTGAVKVWYSDEDTGWIAIDESRPGCSAFGKTRREAMRELADAQTAWDALMARADGKDH